MYGIYADGVMYARAVQKRHRKKAGPVFGAAIFVALEELVWRNVLNFHAGILGIIIVCLLVFIPGGLGSFRHAAARLRALVAGQTSGTTRLRSAP